MSNFGKLQKEKLGKTTEGSPCLAFRQCLPLPCNYAAVPLRNTLLPCHSFVWSFFCLAITRPFLCETHYCLAIICFAKEQPCNCKVKETAAEMQSKAFLCDIPNFLGNVFFLGFFSPASEIKIGKYGLKGNRVAIALPITRLVALESHYCLAKVFWEFFRHGSALRFLQLHLSYTIFFFFLFGRLFARYVFGMFMFVLHFC